MPTGKFFRVIFDPKTTVSDCCVRSGWSPVVSDANREATPSSCTVDDVVGSYAPPRNVVQPSTDHPDVTLLQ